MDESDFRKYGLLVLCIVIPLLAGFIGSLFTMESVTSWYTQLNKPWFTPPDWVFGPVWTALYILMGISLFLVVKEGLQKPPVRQGVLIFAGQLVLNVAWSLLFFGLQSPMLGLIGIILLYGAIIATIISFYKVSKPAAWLLIPYIAWVSIATALNVMILALN